MLLEAAPAGMDVTTVGEAMCAEPDVVEVHDLHVWTVTSGFPALSAHVGRAPGADRDRARRGVERVLDERFGIHHTTLQMVEARVDAEQWPDPDRGAAGTPSDLDDHLDRPAVDAPGRAGDVGGALRAQEDDRRGDLVDLGEPPDRPAGARLLERLARVAAGPRAPPTGRRGRPPPPTARTSSARGRSRSRARRPRRSGRRTGATARAAPPSRPSTRA